MRPKVPRFEILDAGKPKLTQLNRLKVSTRNSARRSAPNRNDRNTDRFIDFDPGPRTVLLAQLPYVLVVVVANADGSIHVSSVWSQPSGTASPMQFARAMRPGPVPA